MQIAAARIFVRDLSAARDFYAVTLGVELRHDGSSHGFCRFQSGALQLIVESVADDAAPEERCLVGRFTGLSFAVADLRAEYDRLRALGVPFAGAPQVQPWGGLLATLRDPSGNELQLVQYPAGAR